MSWISQDSPGVVRGWARVFQVPTATERLAAAPLEVVVPEAPVEAEVDAEAVPLFWRVDLPEAQGGAVGWPGSKALSHCHLGISAEKIRLWPPESRNDGGLSESWARQLGLVKFGMKIYIMNHYDMDPYGSVVHSVHLQSRGEHMTWHTHASNIKREYM